MTTKSALHVEDHPSWQREISRFLQEAGYNVTIADNLEDGLGYAKNRRFDLYVVDGEFPLKPKGFGTFGAGLQLYESIKGLYCGDLNYVIVSSDEDLEDKCAEQGVPFIHKDDHGEGDWEVVLKKYLEEFHKA